MSNALVLKLYRLQVVCFSYFMQTKVMT